MEGGKSLETNMNIKSKNAVIAVAFLIVGILIGATAGYVAYSNSNNYGPTIFWFYIDYGPYETSDLQNGWIPAQISGYYPLGALQKVTDTTVDSDMELVSINGVAPKWDTTGGSWVIWVWSPTSNAYGKGAWNQAESNLKLSTAGMVFYLGFTYIDLVTNAPSMDPNSMSGWQKEGPFAPTGGAIVIS